MSTCSMLIPLFMHGPTTSPTTTEQPQTTGGGTPSSQWGSLEDGEFKPSSALVQLSGGLIESLHDVVMIYSQLWLAPVNNCNTFVTWLNSTDFSGSPISVAETEINELINFFKPIQTWCQSWAPSSLQPFPQRGIMKFPSSNPAVAQVLYQLFLYTFTCADLLSCINSPNSSTLEKFQTMAKNAYTSTSPLIQVLGGGTAEQALCGLVTTMESLLGSIDNMEADDKEIETDATQELSEVETRINQIRGYIQTLNQDISNIKRKIASLEEDIMEQCVELEINFMEIILEDVEAYAEAIVDSEEENGLFEFLFAFVKLLIDEVKLKEEEDKLKNDVAKLKNAMAQLSQELEEKQELNTDIHNALVLTSYLNHLSLHYTSFKSNNLEQCRNFVQDMFEPLYDYNGTWPPDKETLKEFKLRVSAVQNFCAMVGNAQWSWLTSFSSSDRVGEKYQGIQWKLSQKGLILSGYGSAPAPPTSFPPLP